MVGHDVSGHGGEVEAARGAGTASALAPEISANWVISRLRCPGRASTGTAPIRCSAKYR